jgi:excinuclease ABC subunit A
VLQIVVDRVQLGAEPASPGDDASTAMRQRLTDSIETAYLEGGGAAWTFDGAAMHLFSERFDCRKCGIQYEDPQPRLFSFNNPFGACPTCHGFGNIIELDMDLVVPDRTKSIQQGAIEPWTKPHYRTQLAELKRAARKTNVSMPWSSSRTRRSFVDGGATTEYGDPRLLPLARAEEMQGTSACS